LESHSSGFRHRKIHSKEFVMDPNLFRIDFERAFEVLIAIIVLAFFLERALALIFEHRLYMKKLHNKGFKAPIAFIVSYAVCSGWDFDAISVMLVAEKTTHLGHAITAGIIAGGSKAAIKLMQDVWKIRSETATQIRSEQQPGEKTPATPTKKPNEQ
jgi:hypothetical protein